MQTIFIDSDVCLDYILNRQPHFEDAAEIFLGMQNKDFRAYISALAISHIAYFIEKNHGKSKVVSILKKFRKLLKLK